jgi:hypothetical protein
MAKIRLIVEDDDGNQTEQTFILEGDLERLDGIESAVEDFRLSALPQVEQALLEAAQAKRIEQEKKTVPDR